MFILLINIIQKILFQNLTMASVFGNFPTDFFTIGTVVRCLEENKIIFKPPPQAKIAVMTSTYIWLAVKLYTCDWLVVICLVIGRIR